MSSELNRRLKRLIVDTLRLEGLSAESIGDDTPLFGTGLGLDSIDALELVVAIEREFGVAVPEGKVDPEIFRSTRTLAQWLSPRLSESSPSADRSARGAGAAESAPIAIDPS